MKAEDREILESTGWEIKCESPFEIRHEDGSFATGQAADIVRVWMRHLEDGRGRGQKGKGRARGGVPR